MLVYKRIKIELHHKVIQDLKYREVIKKLGRDENNLLVKNKKGNCLLIGRGNKKRIGYDNHTKKLDDDQGR